VIRRAIAVAGLVFVTAACGHAMFVPPAGPGVPADAAATEAWAEATKTCRDAQSYKADLRVSRLSIEAAVTPANIYMGATYSGQSIFMLAGTSAQATLWLRRDNRVVRAPAGDIIEAILGVEVPPDRLLSLLSGCGTRAFDVKSASSYSKLLAVQTPDTRVFLQRAGSVWQTYGVEADGFRVRFFWKAGASPEKIWIGSAPGRDPAASLNVSVRDATINDQIPASIFNAPSGAATAEPMTLEELRTGAWRKLP
jgi:hypothetical protein